MVSKILSIARSKIIETIHPDGERKKRSSDNQKHDQSNNSALHKNMLEENALLSDQNSEIAQNFTKDDLIICINDLNNFECYHSISLKFIMDEQENKIIIHLKDKNGHNLQEYLPLQIKALHLQIKKDLIEIPKGTILNIDC